MVLRRPQLGPGGDRSVPHRPGRSRVGAGRPRLRRRAARLLQRVPPPRGAAVRRAGGPGTPVDPVLVPRLDLRPRRQARRGTQPHLDARCRPRRVRPGARPPAGVARLCLGLPGRRAAVVRGPGDRGLHRAARRPRRHRPLLDRHARRRPQDPVRRRGELEADHRELHGVLPLRDDPPRAHRGAPGVRERLRGAVLRRARSGVRPGGSRGSRSTAARASTGSTGSPRTRTASTTRSPCGRRCSST